MILGLPGHNRESSSNLAGMSEMVARAAVALFLVPAVGFTGACFASPAAWVLADLFLFPCYFQIMRILRQRLLPETEEYTNAACTPLHRAA